MKKSLLNFVLPVFLLISAVVLIGSGCNPTDPDEDDRDPDKDYEDTVYIHIKSVDTRPLYI